MSRSMIRICWAACLTAALAGECSGVVVELQDGERLGCRLVSRTADELVLEIVGQDGQITRRTVEATEVVEIRESIDAARLAALAPDKPNEYRLYAEELRAKRSDPEARDTASRLFLIAAQLAPAKLGRGAMLNMADLAYNDADTQRYRWMAYLLSDNAEPPSAGPGESPVAAAAGEAKLKNGLLQAIRLLRTERLAEAKRLLEQSPVLQQRLETLLPADVLRTLQLRRCEDCERGYQTCPKCDGSRKAPGGGACDRCAVRGRSLGRVVCQTCFGEFASPPRRPAHLRALVEAEQFVRYGSVSPVKSVWTEQRAAGPGVFSLQLQSVSPFDPAKCVFRDGKWVAP